MGFQTFSEPWETFHSNGKYPARRACNRLKRARSASRPARGHRERFADTVFAGTVFDPSGRRIEVGAAQNVLAAVDPEGDMIGASLDATKLAGAVDRIEHQPEIVRHRRGRHESRHHNVGVIELGEFHEPKAECFLEPVGIAERIISVERHVVNAASASAAGNVSLRTIGHRGCQIGRRTIAF